MRWAENPGRAHRWRGSRSQCGAALLLALGSLVVMSIVAVAVAAYSVTVGQVTVSTVQTQASVRQFDGYLEKAVREYRLDPAAVLDTPGEDCSDRWDTNPSWLPGDYSLTCASTPLPSPAAASDGRHATIQVLTASRVVAMANLRIEDKQGSAPLPGSTLTVCAWQIARVDPSLAATC